MKEQVETRYKELSDQMKEMQKYFSDEEENN